jgi:hypothetical protein
MNPVPTLPVSLEEVEIRKKKMFFQPEIIDAACSFLLSCEINHRKTDYDILIDKCFQNKLSNLQYVMQTTIVTSV